MRLAVAGWASLAGMRVKTRFRVVQRHVANLVSEIFLVSFHGSRCDATQHPLKQYLMHGIQEVPVEPAQQA